MSSYSSECSLVEKEDFVTLKSRVHHALEEHNAKDIWSNLDDLIITSISITLVFITMLRTYDQYEIGLQTLIATCALLLLIEYAARMWAAGANTAYQGVVGRFRYVFRFAIIVDTLALIHALLLTLGLINGPLDLLNLLFFAHLVKLSRYNKTLRNGLKAVVVAFRKMRPLLIVFLPMLLVFSYMIYLFEHQSQPEEFANFLDGLWFSIVTATTVGYGDVSPVTLPGKVFSVLFMFMTIGLAGGIGAQIAIQLEKVNGD